MAMTAEGGGAAAGASLLLKPVGALSGTFFVPKYQRGYRWGPDEVTALLDDLRGSVGSTYCLQPVVVRRNGERWELIDGQQRLTTVYLIFSFMRREGLKKPHPPYAITYDTRARCEEFLRDPTRSDEDNIDFHFIRQADKTIRDWFSRNGGSDQGQTLADKLYPHLHETAKVIWYEVTDEGEPAEVFRRLNVGRIPLTDAELLKAVLLAPKGREAWSAETARQWDDIERSLRDEDLWAFLTPRRSTRPRPYQTRIDLLFELLAPKALGSRARYQTFDDLYERASTDSVGFWREVLRLHALLREWFEDREVYHLVGFLITEGAPLRELVSAGQGAARRSFKAHLRDRVRERLNLTRGAAEALTYDHAAEACELLLRLMNVEAVRRLRDSTERYPFRRDKGERWSLEHIHAQNAEALKTQAEWVEWLREQDKALAAVPGAEKLRREVREALEPDRAKRLGGDRFKALAERAITALTAAGEQEERHAIFNLALLSSGANSALSNSVFEVKRQRVLALERSGEYVPVCTRRVFLKYFTRADAQQVHFWSRADREAYREAMFGEDGLLTPYLQPEVTP